MYKYIIAVDAAADIDETFFQENDIYVFPMEYSLSESMVWCRDMESEEKLKAFYLSQKNGELTKTSQITPYLYSQYAEPFLKKDLSILYITLSSGLSSTYQSACLAAEDLKETYPEADFLPLDSLAATGGMGILAERAVNNQKKGMDLRQNYEDLQSAAAHLQHWFLVSDIQYLRRGGRINSSSAAIASVLSIKPILQIDQNGKLPVIGKARGTKAAVKELLKHYKQTYVPSDDPIYICHADAPDTADLLEKKILELTPNVVIRKRMLSPIIGAHTGPGMASIIHLGTKR
ncbi:MAG: DegV family protein [Erysipelotrichaceae bacterium]|nr:DegV family protein [Erysipelotrichaceae bacterium]